MSSGRSLSNLCRLPRPLLLFLLPFAFAVCDCRLVAEVGTALLRAGQAQPLAGDAVESLIIVCADPPRKRELTRSATRPSADPRTRQAEGGSRGDAVWFSSVG